MVSFLLMMELVYVNVPTVDVARVVFLLYHMNSIPKTPKHTPVIISNAKFSLSDKENG